MISAPLLLRIGSSIGLLALSSCSTILSGTSEQVEVVTNPSGATCGFYRQGVRIATVDQTPSAALVSKTKHDIWIICMKQGYQMATYLNHSGVQGATWGNMAAGGLIGWGIDSADGADNHYDNPVNLSMVPDPNSTAMPNLPNTYGF